jgi:predicted ATPase
MRAGRSLLRETNVRHFVPMHGTLVAEAEARAGKVDAALATVDGQLAIAEQTGERWYQAEMHRVRATFCANGNHAMPRAPRAAQCLRASHLAERRAGAS